MIRRITFTLFLFAAAGTLLAQPALETVKRVADKIIEDTSFDFHTKVSGPSNGVQVLDFYNEYKGETGIVYAGTYLVSTEDGFVTIGVDAAGPVKVFLNGGLIYEAEAKEPEFAILAYNMYSFAHAVEVPVKEGLNPLQIKTLMPSENIPVVIGAVDEHNMEDSRISFTLKPIDPEENLNSHWGMIGTFPLSEKGFDEMMPPEITWNNIYTYNDETYIWNFPGGYLLLDDVIPEDAAFQKHSYFEWHYSNGQMMMAMLDLAETAGSSDYFDHVANYCNLTLELYDCFKFEYEKLHQLGCFNHRLYRRIMLDDTGAPALPYIELYSAGYLNKAEEIVNIIAEYVRNGQIRLEDGTLCRPEPRQMTIWADDLFMAAPFMLRYGHLTDDASWFDDAAMQAVLFNDKLFDDEKNLYFHGWYSDTGENSVARWGRANGWVMWAVTELLLHLPEDHKDYDTIMKMYREHVDGLVAHQDVSGMWHQVIDKPESYLETSSTAMFTLGIARGVLNGWLDDSYKEHALKAWEGIEGTVGEDGVVSGICRGTGIGETLQFYYDRETPPHDPRGLGAVITAGVEISKLQKED